MSLATIIKKIEDEAEAQGQKLIAQAEAEGERIVAHGCEEAEKEAAQILRHAEEELQNFKNKQMATTLLQVRKQKLDNRQRILDEVFSKALERILTYNADQYRAMVKSILLSVEEQGEGNLLFSEADKAFITKDFVNAINTKLKKQKRKLKFKFSGQTADIDRGFIIDFKDFEINYSIEKILLGLWEDIKGELSKRLFEGSRVAE